MDELVKFLRDRLDEDEQVARRVESSWRQIGETGVIVASDGDRAEECANGNWTGIAEHIVRHDPARVLAEVEAKRRLLDDLLADEHGMSAYSARFHCGASQDERGNRLGPDDFARRTHPCDCGRDDRVYRRIRLLALPYAEHEAYSEDWRP